MAPRADRFGAFTCDSAVPTPLPARVELRAASMVSGFVAAAVVFFFFGSGRRRLEGDAADAETLGDAATAAAAAEGICCVVSMYFFHVSSSTPAIARAWSISTPLSSAHAVR